MKFHEMSLPDVVNEIVREIAPRRAKSIPEIYEKLYFRKEDKKKDGKTGELDELRIELKKHSGVVSYADEMADVFYYALQLVEGDVHNSLVGMVFDVGNRLAFTNVDVCRFAAIKFDLRSRNKKDKDVEQKALEKYLRRSSHGCDYDSNEKHALRVIRKMYETARPLSYYFSQPRS